MKTMVEKLTQRVNEICSDNSGADKPYWEHCEKWGKILAKDFQKFTVHELPAQPEQGQEENKQLPFPECYPECRAAHHLGVGECESICPSKFDKDGNSIKQQPIPTKVDDGIAIAVPAKTAALMAEVDDKNLCAVCGSTEDKCTHHLFQRKGCKCKWILTESRPICNSFLLNDCKFETCIKCDHHISCHAQGEG